MSGRGDHGPQPEGGEAWPYRPARHPSPLWGEPLPALPPDDRQGPDEPKADWGRPSRRGPLLVAGTIAVVALLLLIGLNRSGRHRGDEAAFPTSTRFPTTTAPAPATTFPGPLRPPGVGGPSQTLTGQGSMLAGRVHLVRGLVVVRIQQGQAADFGVTLQSGTTAATTVLRYIGTARGGTAGGVEDGDYDVSVDAVGPWTITIEQPAVTAGSPLPLTASGTGSQLLGPVAADGDVRLSFHHDGPGGLSVQVLSAAGDGGTHLADDVVGADGTGAGTLPMGVYFLNVDARGPWSLRLVP